MEGWARGGAPLKKQKGNPDGCAFCGGAACCGSLGDRAVSLALARSNFEWGGHWWMTLTKRSLRPAPRRRKVIRSARQPRCGPARRLQRPSPNRSPTRPIKMKSRRSEEHTSELQSLMRISYAVFCLKKKKNKKSKT